MKKVMLSIISFILPTFLMIGNVYAGSNDSTITYERINGVYFYLQNKNTGAVDTNHVTKFYMNGKISYCIEPMIDINDKIFNSTGDWNITNLTSEQRHYIELVGYFGYEYPGHNNDRYWLAAQELIWEKVNSNISVKFTTAENGTGSVIDLSKEKNEILSLANNYEKKPEFGSDTIEVNIGDTITLTDTNNVLNEYDMTYSGKHKVTKNGNQLVIETSNNMISNEVIKFTRHSYDSQTTIIYYQGNSQKLASLRVSDPTLKKINLKVNGATVEIDKEGEKMILNEGNYYYEVIKLPNVTFAIYANEDILDSDNNVIYKKYQLVDTLMTNDNGIAILENLYFGKYFLIEGESSLGNMVNKEKYDFEITKEDLIDGKIIKKLNFNNMLPKGTIEFTKIDSETGKPIFDTNIEIYNENDELVFSGCTDANGKITLNNLAVGKYYIMETKASTGYLINPDKIYFEITNNGEIVKTEMKDGPITGTLEFTKIDVSTSEALPNTLIEIYNENDELVFSGRTDENGKIVVEKLKYGKYYIIEKEAPEGYQLNDEKMWFEILEDGQIVKTKMQDEKIIVEVPNTLKNDYLKNVMYVLIILGIGTVAYGIYKKKKASQK